MTAQMSMRKKFSSLLATGTAALLALSGLALAPTAANAASEPSIELFAADGTTPLDVSAPLYKGDKIVVKGEGFDPASNPATGQPPVTAGDPAGNYVVFGNFAQNWRPSVSGTTTADRVGADQRWAMTDATYDNIAPNFKPAVTGQRIALDAEGSFEATLEAKDLGNDRQGNPLVAPADGSWGVFTYAAGGTVNADQELEVRLDYRGERPSEPTFEPAVKVYLEDGSTEYANQELEAGDKLVVKGTGFDPAANVPGGEGGVPIPNNLPQGTFAVFGNFAENWKPSAGANSSTRVMNSGNRGWALDPAVLEQVPTQYRAAIQNGGYTPLSETGEFTWNVTLAEPTAALPENGNWGIYTYAGGASGVSNAAQEIYTPINFKAAENGGGEEGEQAVGGLQWGFVDSWNSYVTTWANGTITVSDGATKGSDNVIGYRQVSSNYNAATNRGNIVYQGTVVYTSEAHGFEIAIKDPWVTFTADGTTITAEVSTSDTSGASDMSRVIVADLDAATPTENADGTLTWTAVTGKIADSVQPPTWNSRYAGKDAASVTFTFGENYAEPAEPTTVTPTVKSATTKGLQIEAAIANIPSSSGGVYAALIEKGTADQLTRENQGVVADYITLDRISDGSATSALNATAAKLDRSKKYEIIVWEHMSLPTESNTYALVDVNITKAQWDKVFPPKPNEKPLPYKDVKGTTHEAGINWMFQQGYVAAAEKFNPQNATTRGAFATMLMRMNEPNFDPKGMKLPYADVKAGDTHYKGIAWMYKNGYAAKADKYNPANPVTRGAMATFMQRLEEPKYTVKSSATLKGYTDVKPTDTHYKGIAWMAGKGYAAAAPKYNAANSTTRGAMSTFLMRIYK